MSDLLCNCTSKHERKVEIVRAVCSVIFSSHSVFYFFQRQVVRLLVDLWRFKVASGIH